jgi:hypothetical protein
VPLIRNNIAESMHDKNDEIIVAEQIDLIQKAAYDIFKLSEKIKI